MNETASTRPTKEYGAEAGPDGFVGVFQTLAAQHDQVAAMFEQIKAAPGARARLWPQLRRELVSHEHSEVRELYPVLRQLAETSALADLHDDEARELDALIDQLDRTDLQSAAWEPLFDNLAEMVLHHAREEEEATIFPIAQQTIGEARAIELDAKLRATKQQLVETH